jgi:hypothetical protein
MLSIAPVSRLAPRIRYGNDLTLGCDHGEQVMDHVFALVASLILIVASACWVFRK